MQFEIEIKAWVDDPAALRDQLAKTGVFLRDYDKKDRYFRFGPGKPDVRLRQDGSEWYLTWKDKRIDQGVEINHEHETPVQDPLPVEALLLRLGASLLVEKHKTGSAWKYREVLVEASHIEGLGDFVEIERTAPENISPDEQRAFAQETREILVELGIPESRIETRPYTQMLLALPTKP